MTLHHAAKGLLVAAIAFDDRTDAVVETARSLAQTFDLSMLFLHVMEPPLFESLAIESPGFYAIPTVMQSVEQERLKTLQANMDDLVSRLRWRLPVEGRVLQGDPVRMIISEAVAARANFIMTACHPAAYRMAPRGFSTALSLMHDAPMPVLVVAGEPLSFEKSGFHIMIADDLQEATREAARRGYQLAARLPEAKVRHVHVHGDFREMLRDAWVDIMQRVPGLRALDRTPDSLWLDEYEARMEALRAQGRPYAAMAEESGVQVEMDVRTGDVGREIHAVVEDFAPDLIVFGRHKVLRARPFLIGRMPFKMMLEQQRSVLMVPPTQELYARLPFPGASA